MDIIIRNAKIADIPEIKAIEDQSFTDPWHREGFESALNAAGEIFLAAVSEGNVIGFIAGNDNGDHGYIEKVAVSPRHRRMGAAGLLLREFEGRLNEECGFMVLEVRQSNEAAVLAYEKHGFEKIGVRKKFYSDPIENGVIMQKNLERQSV